MEQQLFTLNNKEDIKIHFISHWNLALHTSFSVAKAYPAMDF